MRANKHKYWTMRANKHKYWTIYHLQLLEGSSLLYSCTFTL